jgi:hypothetical protein
MPGTSHWTTQHRFPEDPNPQQHCCEYLRPLILWIITTENKHFMCHFRTREPLERFWSNSEMVVLLVNSDICPQVCLPVGLSATKLCHCTKFSRQTHCTLGSYNFLPHWPTTQLTLHAHLQ